jgi:hypothetical protein
LTKNMPFKGYIQSTDAIDLPSLHRWMQDVIWEPVRGKLFQSAAYQQFSSASNNAFEYDNDGSPAVSQGGKPKKVTEVGTGHAISIFHPPLCEIVDRAARGLHKGGKGCKGAANGQREGSARAARGRREGEGGARAAQMHCKFNARRSRMSYSGRAGI